MSTTDSPGVGTTQWAPLGHRTLDRALSTPEGQAKVLRAVGAMDDEQLLKWINGAWGKIDGPLTMEEFAGFLLHFAEDRMKKLLVRDIQMASHVHVPWFAVDWQSGSLAVQVYDDEKDGWATPSLEAAELDLHHRMPSDWFIVSSYRCEVTGCLGWNTRKHAIVIMRAAKVGGARDRKVRRYPVPMGWHVPDRPISEGKLGEVDLEHVSFEQAHMLRDIAQPQVKDDPDQTRKAVLDLQDLQKVSDAHRAEMALVPVMPVAPAGDSADAAVPPSPVSTAVAL